MKYRVIFESCSGSYIFEGSIPEIFRELEKVFWDCVLGGCYGGIGVSFLEVVDDESKDREDNSQRYD